jgi:flagellar biogenesis protein FliO
LELSDYIVKVVLALIAVSAIFVIFAFIYRKFYGTPSTGNLDAMKILNRQPLDSRSSLLVFEVMDRVYLVYRSGDQFNVLDKFSKDEYESWLKSKEKAIIKEESSQG